MTVSQVTDGVEVTPNGVYVIPPGSELALRGVHLRLTLKGEDGGRVKAVAWRVGDTELGRRLSSPEGAVHVAGRLRADDWRGREGVQLEIEDVADPRRVS